MNYYESRVTKIPKKYIVNSILNTTWLADNNINYCKPIVDDDLHVLLDKYNKDRDKAIKSKIYNGLVWYAAYIGYYMYDKYKKYYPSSEYSDYLSHCLERLSLKIDDWDPSKSNGATFYTRFVDDIKFSIVTYLYEYYGEGLCKRSVISTGNSILNKIHSCGSSVKDVLNLDENEFKNRFNMSKKRFLSYLTHKETVSGNTPVSLQSDDSFELFDTIKDERSSSLEERMINNILSDEIFKLAKTKFKNKIEYFLIWRDYKSGGHTLTSLAEKYYDGDRTRERIRQIINKVDNAIMRNPTYKDIKKAMEL